MVQWIRLGHSISPTLAGFQQETAKRGGADRWVIT